MTHVILVLYFLGYLTTIHRPENNVVLVHVPEILDGERNSEYKSGLLVTSI